MEYNDIKLDDIKEHIAMCVDLYAQTGNDKYMISGMLWRQYILLLEIKKDIESIKKD